MRAGERDTLERMNVRRLGLWFVSVVIVTLGVLTLSTILSPSNSADILALIGFGTLLISALLGYALLGEWMYWQLPTAWSLGAKQLVARLIAFPIMMGTGVYLAVTFVGPVMGR